MNVLEGIRIIDLTAYAFVPAAKVFPEEVERVLRQHPGVGDCIVVGVADATFGSAIAAVVSPTRGARPTLEELVVHAKRQLAGYKQPRHLVLVDEVRRTAPGKPDYRWAREEAERAVAEAAAGAE